MDPRRKPIGDLAESDHVRMTLEDLDLKEGDTILFRDLSFNHFVVLSVKNALSMSCSLRVLSLTDGDVFEIIEIKSCFFDTSSLEILCA